MSTRLLFLGDAAAALDQLITPPQLRHPVRPLLVLEEREDAFEMLATLPELEPSDLEIRVGHDFLELAVEHRSLPRWFLCSLREPARLSLSRRYRLSTPVVPERADARLVSGELRLRLPKRVGTEPAGQHRVRVPVSG